MTTHYLKTVNPHFRDIYELRKTLEIRFNDRKFKKGDLLVLEEFQPHSQRGGTYTGKRCEAKVLHVLKFPEGMKDDFVALSIQRGFTDKAGVWHTFDYLEPERKPVKRKNDFGSDKPQRRSVHGWVMTKEPYPYSIPWR